MNMYVYESLWYTDHGTVLFVHVTTSTIYSYKYQCYDFYMLQII